MTTARPVAPLAVLASIFKTGFVDPVGPTANAFAEPLHTSAHVGGVIAGKKITLVDSATHVRYTLKLVYAGTAPEKVETFTSPARAAAMQTNAP